MSDAPTAAPPQIIVLPIDDIRPYWRNPRNIPESAITGVAESITRYGYQSPIVVDPKHVVLVGHTRLAALRRLGWTEIPVIVADLPADKAREYRVIDNKSAESTSWDNDALLLELREFTDSTVLDLYFPDVDLVEHLAKDFDPITNADVAAATARVSPDSVRTESASVTSEGASTDKTIVSLTCPHCYETIEVEAGSITPP